MLLQNKAISFEGGLKSWLCIQAGVYELWNKLLLCDHRFSCDYCDLIWITACRVAIGLLSIFIWSSHLPLDLHSGLFPVSLPTCIHFSLIMPHVQPILLDIITLLISGEHIMTLLSVLASCFPLSLTTSVSHSTLFSNTPHTRSSTCQSVP